MKQHSEAAVERMMKVREVILRALAKRITWWQAAEILGISDRSMRRWRERYQQHGYDGLFDRLDRHPLRTGALPGEIFRPQRATLPREVEGGARDGVELHLGEAERHPVLLPQLLVEVTHVEVEIFLLV